jgi:hypothetical protein
VSSLRPTAGARFVLELVKVHDGGAAADYAATIYVPDGEHAGTMVLKEDGIVEGIALGEDTPAELAKKLGVIAKLVARDVVWRRDKGEKPWPARVMRWRAS